MDESPDKIGRYEVRSRIGAGGMGEVYEAFDTQLRRVVALKRLAPELAADEEYRKRLLIEARTAARVQHTGISALYDVLEDDDRLFLVMERVEGKTLRDRLRAGISREEAVEIAAQCAEALAAAHKQGIVHGDIKPGNVMITPEGQAKLLDFGVARVMATAVDARTLAFTVPDAEISGTPGYMAPEVLMGTQSDHRADIFSLGVMLYEMLTGVHPFIAATPTAVSDRVLHEMPPPLQHYDADAPPELTPILDKMLAKSAAERSATTEDLVVDLRKVAGRLTPPGSGVSRPTTAPPLPASRRQPWAWLAGAAGVALVVAALALGWQAFTSSDAAPAPAAPATAGNGPATASGFDATDWVIAVLPARTQNQDAETTAINEGLAATLTTRLTQLTRGRELQIVPASVLRDREIDGLEKARVDLGVTLALDFHVQRFGDQLRVNVNLVDTRTMAQLDAQSVDGGVDDLLHLQELVSARALRMLQVELRPMEQGLMTAQTADSRAYGYFLRGQGYLQSGNPGDVETAVQLFEQALRVDPEFAAAHAGLGTALWERYADSDDARFAERAAEECRAALAIDEMHAGGHVCLGAVYRGTGRYDDAVAAYEEAIRLDPTDDQAFLGLAAAHQEAGNPELAEAAYGQAIALRPHYSQAHSWLATLYFRQGRYDEAIGAFEEAVQLAPDSFRGFNNLGGLYFLTGRWTDARRAWARAVDINPTYSAAYSNIGTMYFYEGRYADSASMFERALQERPTEYTIWGNLGDAYTWGANDSGQSADAYRRAIELAEERLAVNPNDATVLSRLAMYRAMIGDAEAAAESLERALGLAPDDVSVRHKAAQVYRRLGDDDKALAHLAAALDAGYSVAEVSVDPLFADDARYQELLVR